MYPSIHTPSTLRSRRVQSPAIPGLTFPVLKDGVEADVHNGTIRPDELILLVNRNV